MTATQPRKLDDFRPLTEAEQEVLDEIDTGQVTELGDATVPAPDAGPDRQVRARFIRWMLVDAGKSGHRLHETGLRIQGALITSDGPEEAETPGLDLEGCVLEKGLALIACRFEHAPLFRSARVENLFLVESVLPGLIADRLTATGSIFLRNAMSSDEVRLLGARIDGDLDCQGAKFRNKGEKALSADGLVIRGDCLLYGAVAEGEVRLSGARIGGDLECTAAQLLNISGTALNADSAQIAGGLFLRPLELRAQHQRHARVEGLLDLTAAQIGTINDDPTAWPKGRGSLALDRCEYGAFTGRGVNAMDRLAWLALQNPERFHKRFWPQPYEQCAKVFREMGHPEDADVILIAKERLQRADRRARMHRPRRWCQGLWDRLLGATVRYGQRPLFALRWLLGFWIAGAAAFQITWDAGAFKPNNTSVLASAAWVGCSEQAPPYGYLKRDPRQTQLACYLSQPEARSFPAFNAPLYALDVLAPVVTLDQHRHWVPDEDIRPMGWWAKGLIYVQILAGWLLSLLAVAGLSGLIRSD